MSEQDTAPRMEAVKLLHELESLGVVLSLNDDDGGIDFFHCEGVSGQLMAEASASLQELAILLRLREVDLNIVGERLDGEYRILTAPALGALLLWEKMPRRIDCSTGGGLSVS